MKDRDLDKKLNTARSQSEKFFGRLSFDPSRRVVLHKIEENRGIGFGGIKKHVTGRVPFIGAAAALVTLLFVFVSAQIGHYRPEGRGAPILQQAVGMDEERDSHLVNYFRIDNPNSSNNLLAILWQKGSRGNYEVIYSSIMENAYTPNPVAVISMPYDGSSFILVSSNSKDEDYIHYRVVKYGDNTATAYLEENYVLGGKVEIRGGMIIEERTVPPDFNLQVGDNKAPEPSKEYRYFIPVALRSDGSFALAANRVRLKKGAVLTLLTDIPGELPEVEYDNEVLDIRRNRPNGAISPSIDFMAKKEGVANLKIGRNTSSDKANVLLIEVVGP